MTAPAPAPAAPFLTLYRWRMAHFVRQSAALYRRCGHAVLVALALGGLLFVERPELLAGPLPHFRTAPADWPVSLAAACGWLAVAMAWSSIHRDAVRGGGLADYAASLPLPPWTTGLVDLALLAAALQVFLLPLGAAAFLAARAGDLGGADGRFPCYLALLAILTVVAARATVFGWTAAARICLPAGIAVLAGAPLLPRWTACGMVAAAVLASVGVLAQAPGAPVLRDGGSGAGTGLWLLLRLQGTLLLRHGHATGLRLAAAALPLGGALWLVVIVGNHADARVLLHLACALATGLMAGFFTAFVTGRAPLHAYLRALPFALARLALAEHLLILAGTGLLFGAAWAVLAAASGPGTALADTMLRAGLYWLAWLPLFGLPVIVRHRDGVLFKIALAVPALVIALYS